MADRRGVLRLTGNIAASGLIGALAARGAWLARPRGTAQETGELGRDLRVGYLPITDAATLLIAHDQGLWEAAGIPAAPPVLFRSWDALAQAFVVGEIDVAHLLLPLALQLRFEVSAPLRVLSWGHTNGSALVTAPQLSNLTELGGRQLAVPYWWSIHAILAQRLLRSAGLTPVLTAPSAKQCQLVVMPPAEMVAALASKQIAGFTVADPFNAAAEIQNVGRVHRMLGDVWREHACCAIVIRQELIDEHPQVAHGIADVVLAAQGWLNGHRAQAAQRLSAAGYLPQPLPAISRALDRPPVHGAHHPHWHGQRLGFEAYPHASYTVLLVELMRQTVVDGDSSFLEGLDPAQAHRDLVADEFITAALARAGQSVTAREEELADD